MNFLSNLVYASGFSKEIPDSQFIKDIENTNLLSILSKKTYLKQLYKITNDFFDPPRSIHWVIHNPDKFIEACDEWVSKKSKPYLQSTKAQYIAPILYCLTSHRSLMEANPRLKYKWEQLRELIVKPDDATEVELDCGMSKKQLEANMSFDEICKIRDELPDGSMTKLLISLYTMIPPIRSDFDNVKIFDEKPKKYDQNYLVLNKRPQLVISQYKTANRYDSNIIDLPDELVRQIKISLKIHPREYLFVTYSGEPYSNANSFNKWANRTIKKALNNDAFSLTMFRHIYLSRPDLDLDNLPFKDRRALGKKMGHSSFTQKTYIIKDDDK